MVESTALEMRRTGNRTVGSNPTLSASINARAAAPGPPAPSRGGFLRGTGAASQFGT